MTFERLVSTASTEVKSTVESLPPLLREAAEACLVEFVEMAVVIQEDDDLEPDCLGLFEGSTRADAPPASPAEMPRIRLFLDNLWAYAGAQFAVYREQVRITFLHEFGHYLALDEEGVAALGLA